MKKPTTTTKKPDITPFMPTMEQRADITPFMANMITTTKEHTPATDMTDMATTTSMALALMDIITMIVATMANTAAVTIRCTIKPQQFTTQAIIMPQATITPQSVIMVATADIRYLTVN